MDPPENPIYNYDKRPDDYTIGEKRIDNCLLTILVLFFLLLALEAGLLGYAIHILNKKNSDGSTEGNGQNFPINYIRSYHPPYTSKG